MYVDTRYDNVTERQIGPGLCDQNYYHDPCYAEVKLDGHEWFSCCVFSSKAAGACSAAQRQKLRKKLFLKAELRALAKRVTGEDAAEEDESDGESDETSDDDE